MQTKNGSSTVCLLLIGLLAAEVASEAYLLNVATGRMSGRPGLLAKRTLATGRFNLRPGKRSIATGRFNLRPGKRTIATGRFNLRPGKRGGFGGLEAQTCSATGLDFAADAIEAMLEHVEVYADYLRRCTNDVPIEEEIFQ